MDSETRAAFQVMERRIEAAKSVGVSAQRRIGDLTRAPADPTKHLMRLAVCRALGFIESRAPGQIAERLYGPHSAVRGFIARAVVNPAQTTVAGWASELTAPKSNFPGLLPSLAPTSVLAALAARGISLSSPQRVTFPHRAAPGGLPPSPFVGEGQPIPNRSFSLAPGSVLTPKKAAAISHFSREVFKRSVPAIESVVTTMIEEDIRLYCDSVLLGASPATALEPAGLLNAVAETTASAATGAEAVAADLAALAGALSPAAVDPVFIASSATAMTARLLSPGAAAITFIETDLLPAGRIVHLDASDFAMISTGGDISVVDDATIVQRDDPTADLLAGSPVSSMFQMDLVGIRVAEDTDWLMRRPARVSWLDASW